VNILACQILNLVEAYGEVMEIVTFKVLRRVFPFIVYIYYRTYIQVDIKYPVLVLFSRTLLERTLLLHQTSTLYSSKSRTSNMRGSPVNISLL